MAKIQRALLSVYDKTGLVPFAQVLAEAEVELVSTGGTAAALKSAGLPVTELSAYTGFPEMLDGRVKTLHPKIHGGLLYIRGNASHEQAARSHGIGPIDLVVVNLYPFEQTVARPDVTLEEAIENIDIGGPAMLRSAAKNHESVTVVVNWTDYAEVAQQVKTQGETTLELRRRLAARVFARTSAYDATISAHLIKVFGGGTSQTSAPLAAAPAVLGTGARASSRSTSRSRSLYGMGRTRTRKRRSSDGSTISLSNCTAKNCRTITSSI
jgi:phosphoribosylaminoimidazolecarboxamide formyltransferase / IMP cyclohydrolase